MTGFSVERSRPTGEQTTDPSNTAGFFIRQARLEWTFDLDALSANASVELSDALTDVASSASGSPPYIRNASLAYRPSPALALRVGRFKRPFSELELESAAKLPISNRGLSNDRIIEDNQWGDRALGALLSGRVAAPKLNWYVSITNPGWAATDSPEGFDLLTRLEWSLARGIRLAAGGGYKNVRASGARAHAFGGGGDVLFQSGGLRLLVEGTVAGLPLDDGNPQGLGVLALLDHTLSLDSTWGLQPTLFFEYADADTGVDRTESVRLVFAFNVLASTHFRIMPECALVRSLGAASAANPWPDAETYRLVLSLVF